MGAVRIRVAGAARPDRAAPSPEGGTLEGHLPSIFDEGGPLARGRAVSERRVY